MEYSIVVPVYNEEKSVSILYEEIKQSFDKLTGKQSHKYEIIFVDDGSTDNTGKELSKLKSNPNVYIITLRKNFGKATALSYGFNKAKGKIVFTMDGDLQDDPTEAPKFIEKIKEGYDVVSGWKIDRQDPADKTIPSKGFNFLVSKLSGVKLHDINCGFKAYKSAVVKNITIYSQLYRFIPILAAEQGFRIVEIPVNHRKRRYGKSKYNWKRIIVGFIDLFTILFITKFAKRPMHIFGPIGFISFISGDIVFIYLVIQHFSGHSIYRRPWLTISAIMILAGLQIIFTGLLAELITNYYHRNKYSVEKVEPDELP